MRLLTAFAAAGLTLSAGAANAASVEIQDAVARVIVIPEARNDIKVEILNVNPSLPLEVRSRGDRTIVDGDLDRQIKSCQGSGENVSVNVSGVGRIAWSDMPQVVIRTPMDAVVEAGGAVFGSVGRSSSLKLFNAGCGDWTVANVAGRLVFSQAGSGDAQIGSAGEALLRVAGSGDIDVRNVTGPLEVDVAGSGDIDVAEVRGPVEVKVAGSGDVDIRDGKAGAMTVSVAGSGNVSFGGSADSLKARIAGSGDVRVKAVRGEVAKTVVGSGAVAIILAALLVAACAPQPQAVTLEPLWRLDGLADPESVAFEDEAGVFYVANVAGEGDARDGNGFISKVSRDGRMIEREWVRGLNAPKGARLSGPWLLVSDIDELIAIERSTGAIVARYPAPGAGFLNDVEVGLSGEWYVSDSARSRIYRLEDGVLKVWLETPTLKGVNGLYADHLDGKLVVTTMEGKLLRIDPIGKSVTLLAQGLGQADGVAPLGKGRYLVGEWPGRLFEVDEDGASRVLLDSRAEGRYINDFILLGDDLIAPSWKPGALAAYRVRR